jgi:hypothetical protein
MYEPQTVFVVGAGASAEFGLPVGWKLLEQIRDNSRFRFDHSTLPKGNRKIFDTVYERYGKDAEATEKVFLAFVDINRGVETAGSIDEFINRYSDDGLIAELGKILIAHAIVDAEAKSKLVPGRGNEADGINWSGVQETWISTFSRALFDGVRANDVETLGRDMTIVCFNYDRCIEHYLEHAIMRAYRQVERKQARQIVSNMNIIHPYGWLGHLNNLSFGTPLEHADLYHISDNLITWSETQEEQRQVAAIKEAIEQASNLVFLGFAFANQNMRLLDPDLPMAKNDYTNVYATGYGLTDDVEEKLKNKITMLFGMDQSELTQPTYITIKYGMMCKEFMDKQLLNFTI